MIFSYGWIQEYIANSLPAPEKLAELLNMRAFEVEEVKKQGDDALLDIKVLPNRPDAMSQFGMAREIASIIGSVARQPKRKPWKISPRLLPSLRVRVQPANVAPRYSALILQGITIAPSPLWMQKRLATLGINAINNVVDVTNYVMAELGQPLHAFDFDTIKNHSMLVRPSVKGERVVTLDDHAFDLPEHSIVIEDEGRIIDLAGIKGGKLSGITDTTKNIILEAAVFDGTRIYKTKKAIQYTTPAADLFSHHLNPSGTKDALQRAYALLLETSKGTPAQFVDLYPNPRTTRPITVSSRLFQNLLALPISDGEIKKTLVAVGCGVAVKRTKNKETVFVATPPAWRNDCEIAEDIVEEVGRIHGYERVPAAMPTLPLSMPKENALLLAQENISDSLVADGFSEVMNYSFVGKKEFSTFPYDASARKSLIEIFNPSNEYSTHLRSTLIERLAETVALNRPLFPQQSLELFEIGETFSKDSGAKEHSMMAAMAYLPAAKKNAGFYRLKGVLERALASLAIPSPRYEEFSATNQPLRIKEFWHPAKTALVFSKNTFLGVLGELHPSVSPALELSFSLYAFECDLNVVSTLQTRERAYTPPSHTPGIILDIALVLPVTAQVQSVKDEIARAGGTLLKNSEVFDVYEGKGIREGEKSVALHLFFHDEGRTLSLDEAKEAYRAIEQAARAKGWSIRA